VQQLATEAQTIAMMDVNNVDVIPRILSDTFYSSLKTLLFSRARVGSASE